MSSPYKTHFVTLPALDETVLQKLEGYDYYYKISSLNVQIGDKVTKSGQVVGEFGVFVEKHKQSYWTGQLRSKKEGTVKKIPVFPGARVTPGYVYSLLILTSGSGYPCTVQTAQ